MEVSDRAREGDPAHMLALLPGFLPVTGRQRKDGNAPEYLSL